MSDYTPGPLPEPFFTLPTKAMTAQGVHVWASDGMHAYAATEVARYRNKLIAEFERRHGVHENNHNYYACLARELKEGEL